MPGPMPDLELSYSVTMDEELLWDMIGIAEHDFKGPGWVGPVIVLLGLAIAFGVGLLFPSIPFAAVILLFVVGVAAESLRRSLAERTRDKADLAWLNVDGQRSFQLSHDGVHVRAGAYSTQHLWGNFRGVTVYENGLALLFHTPRPALPIPKDALSGQEPGQVLAQIEAWIDNR